MVERSAVNRLVVGSSPTWGVPCLFKNLSIFSCCPKNNKLLQQSLFLLAWGTKPNKKFGSYEVACCLPNFLLGFSCCPPGSGAASLVLFPLAIFFFSKRKQSLMRHVKNTFFKGGLFCFVFY